MAPFENKSLVARLHGRSAVRDGIPPFEKEGSGGISWAPFSELNLVRENSGGEIAVAAVADDGNDDCIFHFGRDAQRHEHGSAR